MVLVGEDPPMGARDVDHNRLLSIYRRYLGEPQRKTDVFVGFALFFGGIAMGAIGLGVFLASVAVTPSHSLFWSLREVAIVLAMVGLPAFLVSVVVLLPVAQKAIYASLGGAALCVLAIAVFVTTYPQAWNVAGTDYSPQGITLYAGGLAVLVASTGAALVAHHLDRAGPAGTATGDPASTESSARSDSTADPVTDEEVRRDIDETVAAADITWGGVERTEPKRLKLNQAGSEEIDASGFDVDPNVRTDAGVDDSVAELRKLRGFEPKTERGSGVDDQTDALKALREQSAEEPEQGGVIRSVVDRFLGE